MNFKTCLFALVVAVASVGARADAPLTGTAGSNLTAYNGGMGAINNNQWNTLMNSRSGASAADFGNCNSLILRCAQPKCATGGCTDMDVAYQIAYGCVISNEQCKGHGSDLATYVAAQLVANSTAKANSAANNAASSAAAQSAAQSEQQMQIMQMQMQEMQNQMQLQNAQSQQQLQAALAEQRQIAEQAAAEAAAREAAAQAAATAASATSVNVSDAVAMGVSADVLVRNQASGQIMEKLENADIAMKALKKTMLNTFDYAGCDSSGNNCTGPKRVKAFKQKAGEFFDPYENVLDEVYDALIMAQSLGVDITDIYMMLNGSCNVWGQYMCQPCNKQDIQPAGSGNHSCTCVGKGDAEQCFYDVKKTKAADGSIRVASQQEYCTLQKMLTDNDTVQQNWLDMDAGSSGGIRVACASDALENSTLFRNRKKQATIDLETLKRIIEEDAPSVLPKSEESANPYLTQYCYTSDRLNLEKAVKLKRLPDQVCVNETKLKNGVSANIYAETEAPSSKSSSSTAGSNRSRDNKIDCDYFEGTWTGKTCTCNSDSDRYQECVDVKKTSGLTYYSSVPSSTANAIFGTGITDTINKSKATMNSLKMRSCIDNDGSWDIKTNKCTCKPGSPKWETCFNLTR